MVSELSARLLKGYSITYSTSSPKTGAESYSDFSSSSSSAGLSSQTESWTQKQEPVDAVSSSIPPRTLEERDEGLSNREACFKRRKIDELRFAASRVKKDLEKGGLPFPSIHAKKPRALEGYDIDMSHIQLLGAKAVADSPFLTKVTGKRSFQSICEIDQLFVETHKIYSKQWVQSYELDWDKSTTGSLTSDSESSCAVDIPPLLEDSLKYRSSDTKQLSSPSVSLKTVSMRTALENSNEPRSV